MYEEILKLGIAEETIWETCVSVKQNKVASLRTEWDYIVSNFVSKIPVAFRVERTVDWGKT